jgi:hypothetical protein
VVDENGLVRFYVKREAACETFVVDQARGKLSRSSHVDEYVDKTPPRQLEELVDVVWTALPGTTTWAMEGVERALGEMAWSEVDAQVRSFPPDRLPETRRW